MNPPDQCPTCELSPSEVEDSARWALAGHPVIKAAERLYDQQKMHETEPNEAGMATAMADLFIAVARYREWIDRILARDL